MAGFNVETFKSRINGSGGLYKPNLYWVDITFAHEQTKEPIGYFANSANLPGVQILSSDHRRQGYGTFDRRAFGVQVTDIPITFFVDQGGEILRFFNNWFNRIVNYDQGPRGLEHTENPNTGGRLFEVGYRDDYEAKIQITALNPNGGKMTTYTLHEAFPIQMGDVTVAWAETDTFAVVPIQFTFRTYRTDTQTNPDDFRFEKGPQIGFGSIQPKRMRERAIMDMLQSGDIRPGKEHLSGE